MKHTFKTISFAAALTVAVAAQPAIWASGMPAAQEQEHHNQNMQSQQHTDYSNNEFYRTGNREGYEDYQHHSQRKTHNHKYRSDEDRRAHDTGYKEGWSGHQYNEEHPR